MRLHSFFKKDKLRVQLGQLCPELTSVTTGHWDCSVQLGSLHWDFKPFKCNGLIRYHSPRWYHSKTVSYWSSICRIQSFISHERDRSGVYLFLINTQTSCLFCFYLLRELNACSLQVLHGQLNNTEELRHLLLTLCHVCTLIRPTRANDRKCLAAFNNALLFTWSFYFRECVWIPKVGVILPSPPLTLPFISSGWRWQSNSQCGLLCKCKGTTYTKKPLQCCKQWTHNSMSSLVIG